MRSKSFVFGGLGVTSVAFLGALWSCSDPRADEPVVTVDTCDRTKLSTDPTNPQSSLLAYLGATDDAVKASTELEGLMKDACNAIDTELGLPTGTDSRTACGPISTRIESVIKKQPPAPAGSSPPNWVEIVFSVDCDLGPSAVESCLATCAGPCDPMKCEMGKLVGKCQGTCNGTCTTAGDNIPCVGSCVGEGTLPEAGTCQGECTGTCVGMAWAGNTTASCAGLFTGSCTGTCTGTCDGQPISGPVPDGGLPDGAPPPGGADGNCKGLCVGKCRSGMGTGSNGDCTGGLPLTFNPPDAGPPMGSFAGGGCVNGVCTGTCRSARGSGTVASCTGRCTQAIPDGGAQCDGICRGACAGTLTDAVCEGARTCGQNAQCNNACQARARFASTCKDPAGAQAFAVSDPALHAALRKHAGILGRAVSRLTLVRTALGFISTQAYGDFIAIGLSGDLVRACVAEGQKNAAAADTTVRAVIAADPTTRKFQ